MTAVADDAVDYAAAKRGVRLALDEAIAEVRQLRSDLDSIALDLDRVLERLRKINRR